jgi:tetratricopeptide (TPR) repeat protein
MLAAALSGDLVRAQQIADEGTSRHPRDAALHNNRAALLERRGTYDDALAAAQQGLAADSSLPQLHKNVGDLYQRANRHDEAAEAYARAAAKR